MLDHVPGRRSKLRQQIISQSEPKGENTMTKRDDELTRRIAREFDALDEEQQPGQTEAGPTTTTELPDEIQSASEYDIEDDEGDEDYGPEIANGDTTLEDTVGEAVGEETVFTDDDNPDEEEYEGEVEVFDEEQDARPSLAEFFCDEDSVQFHIEPRFMLNVTAEQINLPRIVKLGDTYYTTSSPLKKGLGTKAEPRGLIREALPSIFDFMVEASDRPVVMFGPVDSTADSVERLMEYVEYNVRQVLFDGFDDPQDPTVEVPAEYGEDDEQQDERGYAGAVEIGVGEAATTHVSFDRSTELRSWVSLAENGDGTYVLQPTIALNVRMPLLADKEDISKPINAMRKALYAYADAAGLPAESVMLAFSFHSADLLEPSIINLLGTLSEDEEGTSAIISQSYLDMCELTASNDFYGIYPVGFEANEAAACIFAEDSDMMILI